MDSGGGTVLVYSGDDDVKGRVSCEILILCAKVVQLFRYSDRKRLAIRKSRYFIIKLGRRYDNHIIIIIGGIRDRT